ncbi:MAG: S8 family serine peptidase, partial [bacterium]
MKTRHLCVWIILLFAIGAFLANPAGAGKYETTTTDGIGHEHVVDHILVKFRGEPSFDEITGINEGYGVIPARNVMLKLDGKTSLGDIAREHLGRAEMAFKIAALNKLSGLNTAALAGRKIKVPSLKKSRNPRIKVFLLKTPRGSTVPQMMELYNNRPDLEYAEPNYIAHAILIPNDADWWRQWGPQKINCPQAWDWSTGNDTVTIAVIDTGVDYNHQDLVGGRVILGYDYANDDNDPMDDNNHGTHCAGIAAATGNNSIGIAGVTWGAKILAVKFLDADGSGSYSDGADAITYAVDNGAKVLSNSWGGFASSNAIEDAVDYAWNNGALFVAAAGNNGCLVGYPARYDNAMAVSATDQNDLRAFFSSWGLPIEVAAPGVEIHSTITGNNYDSLSGTSMACPHVSGLAALIMSYGGGMSAADARDIICQSAEDLGIPGRDMQYGYGRIDAHQALLDTIRWQMLHNSCWHRAASTYSDLIIPTFWWSYGTGDNVSSSAAIDMDGTIYVGSNDHSLYRLSSVGVLLWSYTTAGTIFSSPAIGEDTVYVGSEDDRLHCFTKEYGILSWSYETAGDISSSPTLSRTDEVYVGSNDGTLYNLSSVGALTWSYTAAETILSSTAIGDDTVCVGSEDNRLYAFTSTGGLAWSYQTADDISSSPALGYSDEVCFGS